MKFKIRRLGMGNRNPRKQNRQAAAARPAVQLDTLERRWMFAAGNILVGVSNQQNIYNVIEYTQTGEANETPAYAPVGGSAEKDFVVAPNGDLYVYQGGFPDEADVVVVRDGVAVGSHTTPGMNLIGRTFYGGLDTNGRYIFVADMSTGGDTASGQTGLIRYDTENDFAVTRFATDTSMEDVTIGQDGLVYGLTDGGQIEIFDPETLEKLRQFTGPGYDLAGIAGDADGNVYIGSFESGIFKTDPQGNLLIANNQVGGTDLDISNDGKLLTAGGGRVTVVDTTSLNMLSTFTTGTVYGSTFAAWATSQLPVAPDYTAPTVPAATLDSLPAGATTYNVSVTYADPGGSGIDASTLGNGDVVLTGAGFNQAATFVSQSASGGGIVATYTFAAPPVGDTYTVSVKAGEVRDLAGNPVPATLLGHVTPVASPTPPASPPASPPPPTTVVAEGLPDLTVQFLDAASSAVIPGAKEKLVVQVKNTDFIPQRGRLDVAVYASSDNAFSVGDVLVGSVDKAMHIPGKGSQDFRIGVQFPGSLTEGNYHLLAVVDSAHRIAEYDETNNVSPVQGVVHVAPPFADLLSASAGGSTGGPTLTAGERGAITASVLNAGNRKIKGRLDIGFSAVPVGGGTSIAIGTTTRSVNFRPDVPKRLHLTVTPPATLPAGDYTLMVTLDPHNQFGDINPNNNTFSPGVMIHSGA